MHKTTPIHMPKSLIVTSLTVVCAVLSFFQLGRSQSSEPQVTIKKVPVQQNTEFSGANLFRSYCAVCHGEDAKGNGPRRRCSENCAARFDAPQPEKRRQFSRRARPCGFERLFRGSRSRLQRDADLGTRVSQHGARPKLLLCSLAKRDRLSQIDSGEIGSLP